MDSRKKKLNYIMITIIYTIHICKKLIHIAICRMLYMSVSLKYNIIYLTENNNSSYSVFDCNVKVIEAINVTSSLHHK